MEYNVKLTKLSLNLKEDQRKVNSSCFKFKKKTHAQNIVEFERF